MNNISYFSYPKYICLVKKIIYDHLIYVMYDLHALSLSLSLFLSIFFSFLSRSFHSTLEFACVLRIHIELRLPATPLLSACCCL